MSLEKLQGAVSPRILLLKLIAWRPQDQVDIRTLITTGLDVDATVAFLRDHAPRLVARFSSLVPG